MSTLKVNAIRGTGASSDAISVNSTDGTCTVKATNNLSNRNLIINGAMQVAQRGTTHGESGYRTVDRWQMSAGGASAALTQAQHALTSSDTGPWEKGFRHSYHITNAGQTGPDAGDFLELYQYIEDQNISQSGWDYASSSSYITISFWVKSSVSQKFYGFLYTNQAGAGDSKMYSFTIDNGSGGNLAANTWTKITHKIPGDSSLTFNNDNTNGLAVGIFPFDGTDYTTSGHSLNTWAAFNAANKLPDYTSTWWTTSNATFEFTGVQLEVGSYATDFEHRSYADELQRCKRYYYKLGGGSYLMANAHAMKATSYRIKGYQTHHPEMRTGPTVSSNGSGGFATQSGDSSLNNTMVLEAIWTGTNQPTNTFIDWSPASGTVSGDEGRAVVLYTNNNQSQTMEFDAEL